jgi:hypothetical protein
MNFTFGFSLPGWSLLLLAVVTTPQLIGQVDDPQTPDEVPFIQQTLDRSTEFYGSGMKSLVQDVVKMVKLDEKAAEALHKAAEAAVADKMEKSRSGLWKTWQTMASDGRVNQSAFWTAYRKLPEAILTPDRSPKWAEGLKKVLNAEQHALWLGEEKKRRDRIEKAVTDYLNKGREEWKQKRSDARKLEAADLAKLGNLDQVTRDHLEAGIIEVVNKGATQWGQALEKQVREYVKSAFLGGIEERIVAVENGSLNFNSQADAPAQEAEEAAWQEMVCKLLPAEAANAFANREKKRQSRRESALAMMAVAELDRKIRLTRTQREQLEVIFVQAIAGNRPKVDAMMQQNYLNTEMILMLLHAVPEAQVKPILQSDQLYGWKEAMFQYGDWWNSF